MVGGPQVASLQPADDLCRGQGAQNCASPISTWMGEGAGVGASSARCPHISISGLCRVQGLPQPGQHASLLSCDRLSSHEGVPGSDTGAMGEGAGEVRTRGLLGQVSPPVTGALATQG